MSRTHAISKLPTKQVNYKRQYLYYCASIPSLNIGATWHLSPALPLQGDRLIAHALGTSRPFRIHLYIQLRLYLLSGSGIHTLSDIFFLHTGILRRSTTVENLAVAISTVAEVRISCVCNGITYSKVSPTQPECSSGFVCFG